MSAAVDAAKEAAWRVARQMGEGVSEVGAALLYAAERDVVRQIVSRLLPGGEVEFWQMVEKELRS